MSDKNKMKYICQGHVNSNTSEMCGLGCKIEISDLVSLNTGCIVMNAAAYWVPDD